MLKSLLTGILVASYFNNLCAVDTSHLSTLKRFQKSQDLYLDDVYDTASDNEWHRTAKIVWNASDKPSLDYPIDWPATVFFMFIYNSGYVDGLIAAQFGTWLKHVGEGADIVYITDSDDTRSMRQILPEADKIKAKCHLYKSPVKKDGKILKYKVIDAFKLIAAEFRSNKKYFFKMDPDTYIVPENLMAYVNDLHEKTYPNPVLFGFSNCGWFCHVDGSFYGLNVVAFDAIHDHFLTHPRITRFNHFSRLLNQDDALVSYAYRESTHFPMLHNPLIITYSLGWNIMEKEGISYHALKFPVNFNAYEDYLYFSNGTKRRLV